MKRINSILVSFKQRLLLAKQLIGFVISNSNKITLFPEFTSGRKKAVILFLSKSDFRFYYPIIHHLCAAGYRCYIKFDYRFIQPSEVFFDLIAKKEGVYFFIIASDLGKASFLIKDSSAANITSLFKTIYLNDDIFSVDGNFRKNDILPFSMHPAQYQNFSSQRVKLLREEIKTVQIFFAGNTSVKGYRNAFLNVLHKKMSRNQILHLVMERFGGKVNTHPGLLAVDKPIHIYSSDFWRTSESKDHSISKADWFAQLARANFFLACPGFTHPMCHNLIESMSIGCIPILEHAEYLFPPLVDMVNCISFSGEAGLNQAIETALHMSEAEITQIRMNVTTYYETYLSPSAVVKLFEQPTNDSTLYYYSSSQSIKVYYDLPQIREEVARTQ